MANNFKNDDSFLRKLVVGAAGTNATMNQLKMFNFLPVELERGSTGFKIWKKIKIKRIRVPDILCLKTGLRFESRGKTKLEISMSHSLKDPIRVWDAGLKDEDFVSIVLFQQSDDSPVDIEQVSPVHFVSVKDMRKAFIEDNCSISKPKGVEEGSEIRVIWTSAAASQDSTVTEINSGNLKLTALSGKIQTIKLIRKSGKVALLPSVQLGDNVKANQIVASIIPIYTILTPPQEVEEQFFIDKLSSANLSERYGAAKALRLRGFKDAKSKLEARMKDIDENIYVKLEAAAALALYDDPEAWQYIENNLRSSAMTVPLETQLETVIVASEIPNKRSEQLLIEVLQDQARHIELRAGAAWSLGQFASKESASALIDSFNAAAIDIKIEAARALLRIAEPQVDHLVDQLKNGDPNKRDGISWALARTGKFTLSELLSDQDDDLRRWISYIAGYGKSKFNESDLDEICKKDPEVYFAASVLWQIIESWINGIKEY